MGFAPKGIDWDSAQRAFVERPQKPSYGDLALEFGCAPGSLARLSSENGWPALRARYMEAQLLSADASSMLLSVAKGDRTIMTGYLSLAVVTIGTLQATVERVRDSGKAESTVADVVNTCMFAAKNLADSLRSAGILCAGKLLADGAQKDNGRWDQSILTQINVNFAELQKAAAAAPSQAAAKPAMEVE
jgi:hypothetical protein